MCLSFKKAPRHRQKYKMQKASGNRGLSTVVACSLLLSPVIACSLCSLLLAKIGSWKKSATTGKIRRYRVSTVPVRVAP
jgi:hypothetical protein